jgi:hypothetical protein
MKNFKNQPIRNKNRLWRPCLLMDRDEMSNLDREPPIDDTYQVSVQVSEEKIFKKSTNQKQELSVAAIVCKRIGTK